ncbi:hypothetical protein ACFGVR_11860 [Mucilaginibacter sp. AW1-3]
MRYFLSILMILTMVAGVNQAKPLFGDGHLKQDRPVQRKPPNKDKTAGHPKIEKIVDRLARTKMARSAYITRQLDLTPAQNEKFWPVFNQYQDELFAAQAERRLNNLNPSANSTDKFAIDRKILDIRSHYNTEFLKILPPDKVNMIYKSEEQFRDEMLKQYRDRKEEANN